MAWLGKKLLSTIFVCFRGTQWSPVLDINPVLPEERKVQVSFRPLTIKLVLNSFRLFSEINFLNKSGTFIACQEK